MMPAIPYRRKEKRMQRPKQRERTILMSKCLSWQKKNTRRKLLVYLLSKERN
jgi:hypothetical protein